MTHPAGMQAFGFLLQGVLPDVQHAPGPHWSLVLQPRLNMKHQFSSN
jgi:hypothetical protein